MRELSLSGMAKNNGMDAHTGLSNEAMSHIAGVTSFEVSLEEQKVTVKGDVTPEAVLEKVAKTGKKTELWT